MLDRAVPLLKAGGRIAYVTCSVLEEENGDQVRAFLPATPSFPFSRRPTSSRRWASRPSCSPRPRGCPTSGFTMTPRTTETDGFFVSLLHRA